MTARPDRHPAPAVFLHWLTVVLVVASFSLVWYADGIDDRALHKTLIQCHRSLGLSVLLLTLLRLLLRGWLARPPRLAQSRREAWVAAAVHVLMYGLLLGIPLAGWLLTSASGRELSWFGLIDLPALLARDRDLADSLHDLHESLATGLLVLIGLHALAALWHHHVRKDATLTRMLPARRSS